jgi:signal transduction histidine kinase
MESRNRDLSVLFGAIEAGPLAIARLQSAAIAQEQLNLLMANPQLSRRGFISAKIEGGPDLSYTFASWNSTAPAGQKCSNAFTKNFQFPDALNPFKVTIVRDECFKVAEQSQIMRISALATLLVAVVTLILLALCLWPVGASIRKAELAFGTNFKETGRISFRPIRLLVREGIRRSELEREQALTTMAQQLSHDIRSPLSALKMAISLSKEIPQERASVITGALDRITNIADKLMNHRREVVQQPSAGIPLKRELERLVMEKRTEILNRPEIELRVDFQAAPETIAPLEPGTLSQVLSNLLNNSIEAIDGKGSITIGVRQNSQGTEVIVSDSGKGIPAGILSQIGDRSLSFGKENGNGLGLASARRAVETAGGKLSIQSKESVGTIVRMTFPPQQTA